MTRDSVRPMHALAACAAVFSLACQGKPAARFDGADESTISDPDAGTLPLSAAAMLQAQDYAPPDAGVGGGLRCTADAAQPQKTNYAVAGPYRVGKLDITFDDTSRPITATAKHPAAPSRTLVTTVYYPAAPARSVFGNDPVAAGGPFPLLMYSHGFSSTRNEAKQVGERAASYGYIVVAPDFPLSNLLANNGAPDGSDARNQVGDVSFLIDSMLAFSHDPSHLFAHAIDEARIGATGVSMGGFTTLLATFHPTLQDPRIKVAVPMAPLSALFREGFYHTREVPVLFMHGDLDAFIKYEDTRRAFGFAQPNAHLMTFAKGTHAAFAAQFDDATLMLLNSVIGPPGSYPTNPDSLGCGAVAADIANSESVGTGLGGDESFIDQDSAMRMRACTGDEYKHPSMNATEQVDLAATAVVAMFDAHLADTPDTRSDACRYLLHELPKHPSVTVE